MLPALAAGLGLGLSLIVAIGAQNLFVLRQGIRREHVFVVAAVCFASDAVLIVAGVSGVGLALQAVPWLIDVVRWAGALFLLAYGLLAARRAWRPSGEALGGGTDSETHRATARRFDGLSDRPGAGATSDRAAGDATTDRAAGDATGARPTASSAVTTRSRLLPVVATCLALTWLNPHVYLDTVFLLGSIASTHGEARWAFAAGAIVASAAWFFGLGYGARHLGRWLSTPRAWRILDGIIAVVMIGLAVSLVLPH